MVATREVMSQNVKVRYGRDRSNGYCLGPSFYTTNSRGFFNPKMDLRVEDGVVFAKEYRKVSNGT